MVEENEFIKVPKEALEELELYPSLEVKVSKVHDGDTITVEWEDFKFPVRLLDIDAAELNEPAGTIARDWLNQRIGDEEVVLNVNPKHMIEKWGRLLAHVVHAGLIVNEEMVWAGQATTFEERNYSKIPLSQEIFNIKQWVT